MRYKQRPKPKKCMECEWSMSGNHRICLRQECIYTGINYPFPKGMSKEWESALRDNNSIGYRAKKPVYG